MIIFRNRLFNAPPPPSSQQNQNNQPSNNGNQNRSGDSRLTARELALEKGREQRQLLMTQRMRYRMQAEQRQEQMNRVIQLQKLEQRKDLEEDKQRVRIKKAEESDSERSTLYKTKPHSVPPVPMK
jgi:hypothetical protein